MRVIICGTTENINEITRRLNRDFEIIGYTDILSLLKNYSQFDGIPYKKLCEFAEGDFEYLIVAYSETSKIGQAVEEFKDIKSRLVIYEWFKKSTIINFFEKFLKTNLEYTQLVLGMSHSQCDIQTQLLPKHSFKFSLPSMDLFCHYNILLKLINDVPEKMAKIDNIILEVPYYVFNYDLSKSTRSALSRLFYFKLFNDYHNYGVSEEEKSVIVQFENYLKLFMQDNDISIVNNSDIYLNGHKRVSLKNFILQSIDQIRVVFENNTVWRKERTNTIIENRRIFEQIIELAKTNLPNTKITILVCPFNILFRLRNYRYVKKTKKSFYRELEKYSLCILDDFCMINNPFCFLDHCHLTPEAARKYTIKLMNKLETEGI